MRIQLSDRSIKYPIKVCKNLLVKISKFIFPVDFVVLEMDEDELVPIILGRPFLTTARAVIDVHEGKLSLRVGSETVTFNIGKSMKSKHSHDDYLYFADHTAKLVQEQWVDTEKCHFMVKEGIFLGHKVSGSGIKVDKAKIEAISKLPYPTNVKAIRSFLGHAGFYRRFIKYFSQIAHSMTQILVKDAPFNFFEECIQAFDTFKRELTQAPIMIKPDWSLPFEIICDTSDYAVGAVLGQRIDKHFKPIHYTSKTMNEAQENYTTTKKELLVVVFAFENFRQYLVLSKTIIHDKKGVENLAADHLSRLENPDLGKLTKAEIRDLFPEERLMAISDKNNELCVLTESYEGAWPELRQHKFFDNVTADHLEDIMASPPP
ncbi:reverse transcriptase domain-containing protein [Tanacetum coccineum]